MPPLLDRIGRAARELFAREERGVPPPSAVFQTYGIPALSNTDDYEAFSYNVWLYRAVLSVSMEMARVPLNLQSVNKRGEIEIVREHIALKTLRLPQPIQGGKSVLSAMHLKLVTSMHLMLKGEGFWGFDRRLLVNRAPTRIDVLLPDNMEVKLDRASDLAEYRYRLGDREILYDPMDVVHFKIPSPVNWLRGHAPTQAIRYALDAHLEADKMAFKKLRNSALPGGLLRTDKKVDDEARKKYLAAWNQMYGGGNNTGKTAFLPEGIEFQPVQQSNQEMQFVEGKNLNRDEILANYGVGLEIFGKTESQTRANAEASIFVFMRFGVLPFLEMFVDTLNTDYLPAFPGTEGLTFAYDDPVPENTEDKRATAQTLFGLGAVTPNEVRKAFGYEPLTQDGMDLPYLDLGKMPVGEKPEPKEDPPPFEEENTQPESDEDQEADD